MNVSLADLEAVAAGNKGNDFESLSVHIAEKVISTLKDQFGETWYHHADKERTTVNMERYLTHA